MKKTVLFIMAFLMLASCNENAPPKKQTIDLESKINNLELEVAGLKGSLEGLKTVIFNQDATLDTTEKGYSIAKSNMGNLLVACEDIKPYADGQKITLRIGNPYNMTFNGYSISIRYGPRPPEIPDDANLEKLKSWSNAYATWQKSQKEKSISITDKLLPGRWNNTSIVLAPGKPEEVGFVGIRIRTNQVALY